jgi:2-polyprenyl-3-methyl-5-hydroxy-6-metoxy-1,4-benzoquinol methylase
MKTIPDRFPIIKKHIRGKDVLDFGSVGNLQRKVLKKDKIHLFTEMKKYAKSITGVDLAKSLHGDLGIIYGDAETIKLNKKFDVIVIGDMIEHVENQGRLLENSIKHLKQGGKIIITTPNARSYKVFFKAFNEHTSAHFPETLNHILEKKGFTILEKYCYYGNKRYSFLKRIVFNLLGKYNQNLLFIAKK